MQFLTMKRMPTAKTFLSPYSYKAASTLGLFPQMQPTGKPPLKFIIPHTPAKKRKIFPGITTVRHIAYPTLFFFFIPRSPEPFKHRSTGRYLKRNTYPVYLQNIRIGSKHLVDITNRFSILYLIIHVKNPQFPPRTMLTDIINTQMQKHTTIFPPGKRNINIVKSIEYFFQTDLCLFVDIQRLLPRYSIFT